MKKILFAALIVVLALAGYFAYGFFSPSGEPVRQEQTTRAPRPGEFSNGQFYSVYATDEFEVKYPNWPRVDFSQLPEADRMKVVVSNEGCTFILTAAPLPESKTFAAYMEERVQEQAAKTPVRMTVKDIGGKTAHLEAEVSAGTVSIQSVTYAYETSRRQYYGIGFVAPAEPFDRVCRPLIREVVESVSVR